MPDSTMLEVEVKYYLTDPSKFESGLNGAQPIEDRRDVDSYLNAPDRDFRQTDEALRIRQIGDANYVTYKGPRIDATTKTRREIEIEFESGPERAASMRELLAALGYRPTAVVRKHRQVWELSRGLFAVQVCRDQVDEVGEFAEIEVMTTREHLEAAKAVLADVALELGLTRSERRSYLELLVTRAAATRVEPKS